MAGKLISDLDPIASIIDTTLTEVEDASVSYKATYLQILNYIVSKRPFPRNHIDGLICENAAIDLEHDITINIGECVDSTKTYLLELSSVITKQIDAAWAAGTNAGGLFSGAVAANTVYYVWLIRKDSDGSIDAGFDIDITGSNAPAGYTYKRRIMTVCTDASANIIPADQTGDYVLFKNPVLDRAISDLGATTRVTVTTSAPPGCIGLFDLGLYSQTSVLQYIWVDSDLRTDSAASSSNFTIIFQNYSGGGYEKPIKTNTNRQIFLRGDATNIRAGVYTKGWIDDRGRNA